MSPIWTPSKYDLTQSSMTTFRDFSSKKAGITFKDYHSLHAWSVHPDTAGHFWMLLFEFLDMGATVQPEKAFEPVSKFTSIAIIASEASN